MSDTKWKPGFEITAVAGTRAMSFSFGGHLLVNPQRGLFQMYEGHGRLVADCTSGDALYAAHRLLSGKAEGLFK